MNYFSLIDEIKQVSLRYSEEFYEGDIYEYLNSGNHKYPCIILTVQNITTDEDVNTISATIFAVDRLTNDSSNKLEVQSLCMSKITQILGTLEERVSSIQSNTLTPFTEKFADMCGGMYGEFTLEYIGDGVCDEGLQYKEIELTNNGIYDIIGYDRAIVNVIPVVTLKDIAITANGEYLPSDYDADGFSKVTAEFDTSSLPKVKISKFVVYNRKEEIWDDYGFIDWEFITDMSYSFSGASFTKIKIKNFNTVNCTTFNSCFRGCSLLQEVSPLKIDSATNINLMFYGCSSLSTLDTSNWNFNPSINVLDGVFSGCLSLQTIDARGWDWSNLTGSVNVFTNCFKLSSLIGGETIESVLANNTSALNGLNISFLLNTTDLDRASLRALINGLADLTGQTAQTLTLGATLMAKLTEEDIAIAVSKNWTIV